MNKVQVLVVILFVVSMFVIWNWDNIFPDNNTYESHFVIYYDGPKVQKKDTVVITYANMEFADGFVNNKKGYFLYTWSSSSLKTPVFESTGKMLDVIFKGKVKTPKKVKSLSKIEIMNAHE